MLISPATQTLRLLETYTQTRDMRARDQLVASHAPLVRRLCGRFRRSRESQEDLFQVGVIGLLKAIDRFDPRHGASFSSMAIPAVLGAVLNYLRDHGSLIKVPRDLRARRLKVARVSDDLVATLGRWPTLAELAQACELTEDDVRAALELACTETPRSLDEPLGSGGADGTVTLSDLLGLEDRRFGLALDRMALSAALDALPARERAVLVLRFYYGMSQGQVAQRIEVSQMHVSRLERRALLKLRLFFEHGPRGGSLPRRAPPPRQEAREALPPSRCSPPARSRPPGTPTCR